MAQTKIHGIVTDEDYFEGNLESRGAENGDYAGDTCSLMDSESVGTVVLQEGKKFCDNEKVEEIGNNQFDDCREACSDTEGHNMNPVKRKIDTEVTNAKIEPSSPCGQRKRSKKLFFGGMDVIRFHLSFNPDFTHALKFLSLCSLRGHFFFEVCLGLFPHELVRICFGLGVLFYGCLEFGSSLFFLCSFCCFFNSSCHTFFLISNIFHFLSGK